MSRLHVWPQPAIAQHRDDEEEPVAAEQQDEHEDIEHLHEEAETAAAEHRQRQRAEVPERIVHAFLDWLPTTDDSAAAIMIAILDNQDKLSSASLVAISDVFESAFIRWKDPDERTEFAYRDT